MENAPILDVKKRINSRAFAHSGPCSSAEEGKKIVNEKINKQIKWRRQNGNHVRKDKASLKFDFIKTSGVYRSLVDEWKDLDGYAYTSCGLNSCEREVVIIDCDGTDFGKSTLDKLGKTEIIPNYQRIKENGHSQTGIFIDRIYVKTWEKFVRKTVHQSEVFTDEQWKFVSAWEDFLRRESILCSPKMNESTLVDVNRLYLTTVRLLNNNFSGDLGFTGYCCQNPYSYADGAENVWFDHSHKYSLGELFTISLKVAVNKIFDFKKKKRSNSSVPSTTRSDSDYIVEENKGYIAKKLNKLSNKFETAYQKSIDGAIYRFLCGVKNYCFRNDRRFTYSYAMACIADRKDITKDYDWPSIQEHVENCVEHINENFDPKKMGWSKEQKELGRAVQSIESLRKWMNIVPMKAKGMTNRAIAERLGISTKTVQNLLKKTIEDFDVDKLSEAVKGIGKYKDLYLFLVGLLQNKRENVVAVFEKAANNKPSKKLGMEKVLKIVGQASTEKRLKAS